MSGSRTLANIPTHLIAGALGAGKTSLLRELLEQRPADERWAILVNEFGQVGMDAALLGVSGTAEISISEIPGGCLCCVNGVPFQVGLGRLLRRSRPDRLFIETSGLGHPAPLLAQLAQPPWHTVLRLHPLVMVIDAAALASGNELPGSQAEALPLAGALIMNKSESLDARTRERLKQSLPHIDLLWCSHGRVPFDSLPVADRPGLAEAAAVFELSDGAPPLRAFWRSAKEWQRREQRSQAGSSIGWLMHPSVRFDRPALQSWLLQADWLRAKLVIHTEEGWLALNALPGADLIWSAVGPRSDNRIELIMPEGVDTGGLEDGLRRTVLAS